jgi:LacI family transcriptional regulator
LNRFTKARRLLIEPLRVVTRRSTDIIAQGDPEIAVALRFLQDHAGELIGVGDVVKRLMTSRRALEIRFRKAVGRTVREELERIRLERAKRLLLETDHPITRVAEAAGFNSPSYLAQVFRRNVGQTPARYRMQGRTPSLEE